MKKHYFVGFDNSASEASGIALELNNSACEASGIAFPHFLKILQTKKGLYPESGELFCVFYL